MTEQKESFKNFVEDLAKIWLEYLLVYAVDGVNMEEEVTDPMTGESYIQIVNVPQSALKQLQAAVKIDITPKGAFDKFAQEQTIENLLMNGFFTAQRIGELKIYAETLDDDSVAPKMKILEAIDRVLEEQQKIAQINADARMMQQRASQFLMGDPDEQSAMMAEAAMQAQGGAPEEEIPEEQPIEEEIQ